MLPIDEHAKSGAEIYGWNQFSGRFEKVRWKNGYWHHVYDDHYTDGYAMTHYLPASWVEKAGAMREELKSAEVLAKHTGNDAHAAAYGRLLDATEWPPKQGEKK